MADEAERARIEELGYTAHWHPAERKGYSGVATLCLTPPLFVARGVSFERSEGRVLVTEHGDFTLYNIYFPNGRQRPDTEQGRAAPRASADQEHPRPEAKRL